MKILSIIPVLTAILLPVGCTGGKIQQAVDEYVAQASKDSLDICSIAVAQHGRLVGEKYISQSPDSTHAMWSVSKTFTSFAVGLAIDEGYLTLDTKIADILREEITPVLDTLTIGRDNLLSGTVRDYLMMGCGQAYDPVYCLDKADGGLSYVQMFFTFPFTYRPGTHMCYNSMSTYILSAAVQKLTGQNVNDYLETRLWTPLGIEKPVWDSVEGISCGGWGLHLKTSDMLKVGMMMLDDGRYGGKQIIPEGYIQDASFHHFKWDRPYGLTREEGAPYAQGYGYQIWWMPDAFAAKGAEGQFIIVLPKKDAVIAATADIKDDSDREVRMIYKYIVPKLKDIDIPETVFLSDYLDGSNDAMPAIRAAIEHCREKGAQRLVLPSDTTLRIMPTYAFERFQFVSNNDSGQKRIAFDLDGMENFSIEGCNTSLLFTGSITPFSVTSAHNIAISGVKIDYTRTFHSEGLITASGEGWCDLKFPENYGNHISNNCLHFENEIGEDLRYVGLLEFDRNLREPACGNHDYWMSDGTVNAEEREGVTRIFVKGLHVTPGNTLVFGVKRRENPGIFISKSSDITISDVELNHCASMGVLAQMSRNIEISHLFVTPSAGRMVSLAADATHFSSCTGEIKLENCLFENQKDDATNIHGLYMAVDSVLAGNKVIVSWRHYQQKGLDPFAPGMDVEIVDNRTMQTVAESRIKSVKILNQAEQEIVFECDVPAQKNYVVAAKEYPDVLIRGCRARGNRARGFLIGSSGEVIIKNNWFHVPGAAILFEGDGNFWFEQSGVKDVTIEGNVFEDCCYMYPQWGAAAIAVGTGIPDKGKDGLGAYHSNISIQGNEFTSSNNRILSIYSVDGLVFRGNIISISTSYPLEKTECPIEIKENCSGIQIEN